MSKKNWREGTAGLGIIFTTAAAGVVFTIIGFIIADIKSDYQHRVDNATRHEHATDQYISKICLNLNRTSLLDCVRKAVKANREDIRAEESIDYQRHMSNAAWSMLLTSFIALLMTGVGIYLLWKTLKATKLTLDQATSANGEARRAADAAEIQTRAHLLVQSARTNSDRQAKIDNAIGLFPHAEITILNCGKTPARNISIHYDFLTPKYGVFEGFDFVETIGPGHEKKKDFFWSDLHIVEDKTNEVEDRCLKFKILGHSGGYAFNLRVEYTDIFNEKYILSGTYVPKSGNMQSFGLLKCENEHEEKQENQRTAHPAPPCRIELMPRAEPLLTPPS